MFDYVGLGERQQVMSIGVVSGHSRAIISFMNGYLLKVQRVAGADPGFWKGGPCRLCTKIACISLGQIQGGGNLGVRTPPPPPNFVEPPNFIKRGKNVCP